MREWWKSRTLRFRLALWYAVCGLFLLATFGAALYFYVANRVSVPLDQRLRSDLASIQGRLAVAPGGVIRWDGQPIPSVETWDPGDPWFELWDEQGQLRCRLWPFANRQLDSLPNSPARGRDTLSVFNISRDLRLRTLTTPYRVEGQAEPWMIRVMNAHEPPVVALEALRWTLFIAVPGIVTLLVGGGYVMMRYWVKPLDKIVAQADRIGADDLSRRLDVHNPHDELGRIATVFNRTLDRLEGSFATLDRFVADASHELRTPLTTLRSVGQVALRRSRSEPEYREVITSMLEESQHLESLIHRLLELASVEGGAADVHRSRVQVSDCVATCIGELGVLAEAKGQRIEFERVACETLTDPVLLRQALQNILDNAIKYGPRDSTIRIEVVPAGAQCHVLVSDEGPGLNADSQAHLGERFFRPDRARSRGEGGFGLGLSITMAYMRALGGTLAYEASPPSGGRFRLTLPAGAVHNPAPAARDLPAAPAAGLEPRA